MKWIIAVIFALFVNTVSAQQIQYAVSDSALPTAVLNKWRPDSVEAHSGVPRVYQQWWNEICDCAGIRADLRRIGWWRVVERDSLPTYSPRMAFRCPLVGWCAGWSTNKRGQHHIFIAYHRMYEERLIKHEMLHDLLGRKNLKAPSHHLLFSKCEVL